MVKEENIEVRNLSYAVKILKWSRRNLFTMSYSLIGKTLSFGRSR